MQKPGKLPRDINPHGKILEFNPDQIVGMAVSETSKGGAEVFLPGISPKLQSNCGGLALPV
jgi:hypothetical protein